jgi:uncharacterized membrane protein YphA (DoxX/SURF4 family)
MLKDRSLGARGAVSLVARGLVAVVFVVSGGMKLLMYSAQVEMFVGWGVPFPELLVPVVGVVETVAGVAVLVGFLARGAAAVLGVVMVGAFLTAGPNGLNVSSFLLCVVVAVNGTGGWYVMTEKEALERTPGG